MNTLLQDLLEIQACLTRANEDGTITDTIWITPYETLFDRITQMLIAEEQK